MQDYNALLSEKVQAEYDSFINNLTQMTVNEVIARAYEKVIKEDMVVLFEEGILEPTEAKALYKQTYPLDYCYQQWLSNDCSYMDMLRDTVDDVSKYAVKEMKEKSRESR